MEIKKLLKNIIIGSSYGEWTPLELLLTSKGRYKGGIKYICRCSCGHVNTVLKSSLISGKSRKCIDCSDTDRSIHALGFIGKKIGAWTFLSVEQERSKRGEIIFLCRCSCGKLEKRPKTVIERGVSRSCMSCGAKQKPKKICKDCGCRGHKNIDFNTNECELLGFCKYCDSFTEESFLLK